MLGSSDNPSGHLPFDPSRSSIVILVLIALILFAHFAVWSFPRSDPEVATGVATALPEDGLWPLAGARAAVLGGEAGVPDEYQRPLLDSFQAAIYRTFGISSETSRLLPWLGLLGLLILLPALTSRHRGRETAVLCAILLATEPTWISWCRAPVILPLASFFVVALPALATVRGWIPPLVALFSTLVVSYSLSPLVVIALPAVFVEVLRRLRSDSPLLMMHPVTLVTGSVLALLAVRLAPGTDLEALAALLTGSTSGPDPSTMPSITTLMPALLLFWWFSFLLFLRSESTRLQSALHLTVFFGLLPWLVTGHLPVSPLLVLFPLLVWLSIDGWAILRDGKLSKNSPDRPLCWFCWLGTALLTIRIGAEISTAPVLSLAPLVGLVILALAVAIGLAARFGKIGQNAAPVLCALVLLLGSVPGVLIQLGGATETWSRARATLPRLLPPGSLLGGRWAHALALDKPISCTSRADDPGVSHVLAETWAPEPAGGVLLDQVNILGQHLFLARVAGESKNALDRARVLESRGDSSGAKEEIFLVLRSDAQMGLAWERLGRILLAEGDVEGAVECFGYALQTDPDRAEARFELARLYFSNGYVREGNAHLKRWIRLTGEGSPSASHDPGR